jgi:hypothetical protein
VSNTPLWEINQSQKKCILSNSPKKLFGCLSLKEIIGNSYKKQRHSLLFSRESLHFFLKWYSQFDESLLCRESQKRPAIKLIVFTIFFCVWLSFSFGWQIILHHSHLLLQWAIILQILQLDCLLCGCKTSLP